MKRSTSIRRVAAGLGSGVLLAGLTLPFSSKAADSSGASLLDNTNDISLEDLVNIKVTSVSKKEENLFDAPAAISVLSNDDIRRSGATSVPEALRWVPGMVVGQVNSSQWAVSSRGLNNLYADDLLVLVDGRAVYSPLFAGVYWDLQQPMLDDVDRIEVIRGPGATMWGANAVNGVVNVVTRSARDTQGGLVYGGGGNEQEAMTGARYGGQIGANTYYRVFGSYQLNDDFHTSNGQSAQDGWQGETGGFRVDSYPHADTQLTWQGDTTVNQLDDNANDAYNINTLGRWTHNFSDRSSLQVQAYYDRTYRDQLQQALVAIDTGDISVQQTFGLGERNDVIFGLGYRFVANHIDQTTPAITVQNGDFDQQLFNGFVQDEFKIVPDRLTFTAGTKLEHNDYTGFEVEPSVKLMFKPTENQTIWSSVSRAVRTPDELEARNVVNIAYGMPFVGPGGGLYLPALVGNPSVRSEVSWDFESGYRIQPAKWISVDVAAFFDHYHGLIGYGGVTQFVPGTPVGLAEIPWENNEHGFTYGGEASVTVTPMEQWRLTASYSLLREIIETPENDAPSDPKHQVTLRTSYDFTKRASADVQLRFVDGITGAPAYVTADVRLAYQVTDALEVSLTGQNLFQGEHQEGNPTISPYVTTAEVPRGVYGKVTWRF